MLERMNRKRSLKNRIRGWLPKEPNQPSNKVKVAEANQVSKSRWSPGFRNLMIANLLGAATVAAVFAATKGYSLAVFFATFTGMALGLMIFAILRGKTISQRFEERKIMYMKRFKEKLAKEGTVELTESIAKGKRFPGGSNKINELLRLIENDAKVVTVNGRIFAIHRLTLAEILGMLPMNDEEMDKLTEPQRRTLETAVSANIVSQKNGKLEVNKST
jgi:dipeptide/tripeptide permease